MSNRTDRLAADSTVELDEKIRKQRMRGYVVDWDSHQITRTGGVSVRIIRRDDYMEDAWAWTDRDVEEFKSILSVTPLLEVDFRAISESSIPERHPTVLRRRLGLLCEEVYGVTYEEFAKQRKIAQDERRDKARQFRQHMSKRFHRTLETVTRAVQIVEGDVDSPEVVMIRGEVYVKQKAAQ